ncbi:MAG: cytochrome c oxidase subunit II [Pseudomonadota bacterium]
MMKSFRNAHYWLMSFSFAGILDTGGTAYAASNKPWQLGLPEPVTPVARDLAFFHDKVLLPLTIVISVFVLGLIIYICWRFSEKNNPTPSKTTHHTLLEVVWTAVPALILVAVAFPSMSVLYKSDDVGNADMTLKVTGNQWFWTYEYPDQGGFIFDANMVQEEDLPEGREYLRNILTDNVVVLPVDTRIRLQFTSNDVLHNWSVSDFAVRMDTVPGRLNEAWMTVEKIGEYYGFCSELCGLNHAYMPITVRVVSKAEFEDWAKNAQAEFAATPQDALSAPSLLLAEIPN